MYYARPALAEQLADALSGKNPFGDAPNGLFLAAPRRTGKSTFLQRDLAPALERRGVLVIYVDFWSDTQRDPGEFLADALGKALAVRRGALRKLAAKVGLARLSVKGAEFDFSKVGTPDGATLPDALMALEASAKRPVALILDEAQHALSSVAGESAMMALKSARDQMNRPDAVRLMLVLSGSDRDKLLKLVNTGAAPFYGSQIMRMPTLGADFVEHVARLIEKQRPDLESVDRATLQKAFEAFGSRPQFFTEALDRALSPFEEMDGRPESRVLLLAREHERAEHARMESEYLGLSSLQRAIIDCMLEQGPRYQPYDSDSVRLYRKSVKGEVSKTQIQAAIRNLRQRDPPIIWKSARGEYAIEDAAMHAWFEEKRRKGKWPPR